MMLSTTNQGGRVLFPENTGERVYMQEFRKADGLPTNLKRWQDTVDQMLDGIDANGPIFLMVDQGYVRAGGTLRRPGLHVDGYWHPAIQAHGGGGHGSTPSRPAHSPYPGHTGYGSSRELIMLASDVMGCKVYIGEFEPPEWKMGDCNEVSREGLLAAMGVSCRT
jgi:hypothetical protein